MNPQEIREKFFYAMSDAGMYDATIEWVAPHYKLMHQMMHQLVGASMRTHDDNLTIALDVGSGTGTDAIAMLKTFPNLRLIGLDLCGPMNELFKKNARENGVSDERFALIQGDLLDPDTRGMIQGVARTRFGASKFNIVTSAFTFHHFSTSEKQEAFRFSHEILSSRGLFLLGDLFNFGEEAPWLTQTIFNWEVEWIADNFEQGATAAAKAGQPELALKLRSLKEGWINHYLMDNKLDGVTTQLRLLKAAGFQQAGNPFRYWQVGLISAIK